MALKKVPYDNRSLGYRITKRTFDIAFSAVVVVVGFLPGVVLGAFVVRDTGGSAIYTQERVGKNGKPFKILKFRTMVADADDVEKYFTPEQVEVWKRERKVENDPRITKLGYFLRKTSIDEFPQFVNSLKGEMSVIGPRAITSGELEWFEDGGKMLLTVRPGITGMWQTGPRNEFTFESGKRQQVELEYIRTANVWLDVKLFFRTFKTMAKGTGR